MPLREPTPGTALYQVVKTAVSQERLEAYRLKGDSDLDLLTRYNWNICASEALYPSLHNLEVAFRNSLHSAISAKYGTANWMWSDPPVSRQEEKDQVAKAEDTLIRHRKRIEPPRMVAELTFGFWTSLLNRRYERVLWPGLLKDVFPFLPARVRRRDFVSARFENIRRLRNRTFHNEPIWRRPLVQDHAEILEAIGWIDPQLQILTQAYDRFAVVHTNTFLSQLRARVEQQSLQLYQASLSNPSKTS